MKKKIKDITIGEMAEECKKHQISGCYDCPLCDNVCGRLIYRIIVNEDLEREVDLCLK